MGVYLLRADIAGHAGWPVIMPCKEEKGARLWIQVAGVEGTESDRLPRALRGVTVGARHS